MEGSRHERAALAAIAYFIGALTVFIWSAGPDLAVELEQPQTAALSTALPEAKPSAVSETSAETVNEKRDPIRYRDGVLEIDALGGTRVLSFNETVADVSVNPEFADQGVHVGKLAYVASPAMDYVFFCEQKSASADTCSPFIYDVLADVIYPVRKDGERVEILLTAARDVVWSAAGLTIGGVSPKDKTKPWLLGN